MNTEGERIKKRDAEIERVNKLNEKRIKAGLFPQTNWAYIEKRGEESRRSIEKYKKSTLSLEQIRDISFFQNRFRFKNSPITIIKMELIKKIFDEYYSNWKIQLPNENLNERLSGYIQQSGWLIQYCFGIENGIEYMDYYASHRMTDDCHARIYENGKTIHLPAFRNFYTYTTDNKEHEKEAFAKHNMEVTKLLLEKGFDKFTINMTLQSGM